MHNKPGVIIVNLNRNWTDPGLRQDLDDAFASGAFQFANNAIAVFTQRYSF